MSIWDQGSEVEIRFEGEIPCEQFDAVVIAVPHDEFRSFSGEKLQDLMKPDGILFDLQNCVLNQSSKLTL